MSYLIITYLCFPIIIRILNIRHDFYLMTDICEVMFMWMIAPLSFVGILVFLLIAEFLQLINYPRRLFVELMKRLFRL